MTTQGVPYSLEISRADGNDEDTGFSRYSSLGAPHSCTKSLQELWTVM